MVSILPSDGLTARPIISVLFACLSVFVFLHPVALADDKFIETRTTMEEFVRDNPSCLDFTDECSVCTITDGKIVCSAPRIQCQVKQLTCTRP